MSRYSRRDFLKASAAAGAAATLSAVPLSAETRKATDLVTLGKSNVRVTRLAFGTGTNNGAVQRNLGQEGFNRLVRYAYDHGIRFYETSDSYSDMHRMLGIALKGIPRDTYQLMTKVTTEDPVDPQVRIDELRKQINSDYFDIALLHWQHIGDWPSVTTRWQDGIVKAQDRKAVIARGASVHGLPALRRVPDFSWLEVAMIRVNHNGTRMDTEVADGPGRGNVPEVVEHVHKAHAAGMGVISMKLAGEGSFGKEDRQRAMRFAFQNAKVDSVTVGYKSAQEIDEALDNLNQALA